MAYTIRTDQSRNGVKVIVHKEYDDDGEVIGSVVEADCHCFGYSFRTHSTFYCKNAKAQREDV